MYRKLTTAAAVAALAFGLAACGGGSDEPTASAPPPAMPPDPMPPAPTPVAVTVTDAMYLDAENMPMAGSMTIAAGETHTSGGVTFLCAEGGEDCVVTVADDGSVTATGGMVTASLTAAAMMQVAEAKEMRAEEDEAARIVRVKRVIGEDRAIEGVGSLQRAATAGLDATEIRISRAQGGTARVRVAAPATAPDATIGGYVAAEDAAMVNGEWAGARLTRPVAGATQQLVVYTDIEEPTRVQFYNFDRRATTASRYVDTAPPAGTDPYPAGVMPTALTISAAGFFTGAVLDPTQFPQRGPAAGGDVRMRFAANVDTNSDANNAPDTVRFTGNYNGAPGTYTCLPGNAATDGGACTVSASPAGLYTSVQGDGTADSWTFTPELNATAFQADGEFVRFGWWMQTPRSPDGTYSFNTWFHGTDYAQAGTPVGPATYTGRAAGRYAIQELGTAGVVDGSSGEFTAAATLTATFSPNANMISGTINGFQGDGDTDMSGWEVTLNRINVGATLALTPVNGQSFATGEPDPTATNFDGATATMGDQTAHGTWRGAFLGNEVRVTDPAGGGTGNVANVNNAFPRAVGGTFQADNDAVSIAGAFGARR